MLRFVRCCEKCWPSHPNCCIMTQWNVPCQEILGSLKQHRRTCTNTLLCLWRGKALMEIIGLLGSDISKCAICFPSIPSLMAFDTIPIRCLSAAAVLHDITHPSLILALPLSLGVSLAHGTVMEMFICYRFDFAGLVRTEVTQQRTCETTVPKPDSLVKINMEFCQGLCRSAWIWFSLPFLYETSLQYTDNYIKKRRKRKKNLKPTFERNEY